MIIKSDNFPSPLFTQSCGSCVLASYGVALYPFTGNSNIVEYFEHFCADFGVVAKDRDAEKRFETIIRSLNSIGGWTGFEVIVKWHSKSRGPFERARAAASIRGSSIAETTSVLQNIPYTRQRALAIVFVPKGSALLDNIVEHIVVAGFDGEWFIATTQKGGGVLKVPSLASIAEGSMGDTLLITENITVGIPGSPTTVSIDQVDLNESDKGSIDRTGQRSL